MAQPRDLKALTGLRAIAALWVVFHHYFDLLTQLVPQLSVLKPLARTGFVGVELFFTLSGFIIGLNYYSRFRTFSWDRYKSFLWLRLARVYPAYLATLLGLLVLVIVGQRYGVEFNRTEGYDVPSFWASVFMVQAWGDGEAVWNIVGWSVSAEWFAYLGFPLVALLLRYVRQPLNAALAAMLILAGCLLLHMSGALADVLPFSFVNLLRVTGSFVAGALMYRVYRQKATITWHWNIITPVLGLGVPILASVLWSANLTPFLSIFLMPPLILGLAYGGGRLGRLLSSRVALYWGAVSYSLYLTHFIVRMALSKVLPPDHFADSSVLVRVGVGLAYLVAAGLVGMAMYHLVEEPGRNLMRRWSPVKQANLVRVEPPLGRLNEAGAEPQA
jgi:peptidoglycan/LPS O-acetylase OafA/YrhL